MNNSTLGKILFPLISVSLMSLGMMQSAAGEVVSTESALQLHERSSRIDRINSVLAEQQVHEQLVRMGVDPRDAAQRITALSDSELQAMDQRLSEMPAGAGALEIMGIVLLVLLILELVGVTDIFKSI